MIVTGEGQIKAGNLLRIVGKNTLDDQEVTAKEIINVCGNEEVIIDVRRNRYFITKLLGSGESWVRQVQIIANKVPRKNCHSCQHLEWIDGDCEPPGDNSGYVCNKRHDAMHEAGREDEFLAMLDSEKYRLKGKRCHEPFNA